LPKPSRTVKLTTGALLAMVTPLIVTVASSLAQAAALAATA
jgi:hypothetical protein